MDPQRIFTLVRELEPAKRDEELRQKCGSNYSLYSILSHMIEVLDEPPPVLLEDVRYDAGAIIDDRYKIEDTLGRGSTAIVYRAFDLRMGRKVALKVFNTSTSRRRLQAIVAEANVTARIDSEFVVRVHGASALDAVVPFLDLELCGDSTTNTLRKYLPGRLDEALLLVEQVARGVHAAHERGVFHRDIKPDNILIETIGNRHRAKVTDFGLAAAELAAHFTTEDERATRAMFSFDGKLFRAGTPAYMAPEQARGTERPLDPTSDRAALARIDVYAIGATLYEVLRGAEPYRSTQGCADPVADVLAQIEKGEPADLRTVPCRLPAPRRARKVVSRAMARDPTKRHATALDLASDLCALREARPTSVDGSLMRVFLLIRRNFATFIGAGVMLVAIVVALVLGRYAREKRREANEAIATRRLAEKAARDAIGQKTSAERARAEAEKGLQMANAKANEANREAQQSSADAEQARQHAKDVTKDSSARVRAAQLAISATQKAQADAEAEAAEANRMRKQEVAAANTKVDAAEKALRDAVSAAGAKVVAAEAVARETKTAADAKLLAAEKKRQSDLSAAELRVTAAQQQEQKATEKAAAAEVALAKAKSEIAELQAELAAKKLSPENAIGH